VEETGKNKNKTTKSHAKYYISILNHSDFNADQFLCFELQGYKPERSSSKGA
jgi:hypothetical protein